MNSRLLLFLFLLLFPLSLKAQFNKQRIHFETRTIKDGLSASTIESIFEDNRGFIWLGTQDGLNRYDGYDFRKYYHKRQEKTSISENYIRDITSDHEGNLWICAYSGGISVYNQKTDRFQSWKHDPKNPNSLVDNRTTKIIYSGNSIFWIGTEHGLSRFDIKTNQFINFIVPPGKISENYFITSLCKDRSGNIWAGTTDGLIAIYSASGKLLTITSVSDKLNVVTTIKTLYTDKQGNSWAGTDNGIYQCSFSSENKFTFQKFNLKNKSGTNETITAIRQDNENNLWVGTENNGICIVNLKELLVFRCKNNPKDPGSLPSNAIYTIYVDKKGNTWIGTESSLAFYSPFKEKFTSYTADHSDYHKKIGVTWGIYQQDSILLLGNNNGLLTLDRRTGLITKINTENSGNEKKFYCFLKNKDGFLSGTSDGLFQITNNNNNYKVSSLPAKELKELQNKKVCVLIHRDSNNIWIGTYENGLYLWNPTNHLLKKYESDPNNPSALANEVINIIYRDKEGVFWFGTDAGFSKYLPETDGFINYLPSDSNPNSINKEYVYTFYDDGEFLWIGTFGGGLNRFHKKSESFAAWTIDDGLPNNAIYGILPDNWGRLWISTNGGLSCFNKVRKSFTNYTESDGLQSNEFDHWSFYKDTSTNELFFGGINGVSVIQPEKINRDEAIPPIVITDIRILDKPLKSSISVIDIKKISLPYFQNHITFDFTVLNFASSDKNKYKYKLEGLNKSWSEETHLHQVYYTNIPPGEYTFNVIGCNNDGTWNTQGAKINICILPPFYKTIWFYSLCGLLLATTLYLIYRYRINQLLKLQAVRNLIARDLHDDIGATLGSISLYSEVVKKRILKGQGNAIEVLDKIGTTSRQMIDKMGDIVWSVNPENDSLDQLVTRMKSYAAIMLTEQNINYLFADGELDYGIKLSMQQRQNVYLIYKEAIFNIVKYSACKNVFITLSGKNSLFVMQIKDDGKGFTQNEVNAFNGNGLKNMKWRIEELKGILSIDTAPGSGTFIELKIPL